MSTPDNGAALSLIARKVLLQAMQDYSQLQHPRYRRRKHLKKAYESAVELFFDPEYRLASFEDEWGEDMDLEAFLKVATERERVDIPALHDHLITSSLKYWEAKAMQIQVVEIPEDICIEGHVYTVTNSTEVDSFEIDFDSKEIVLNTDHSDSENQEAFCLAVMELVFHHEELNMSTSMRKRLGKVWFRTLRINNCFTGVK